MSHQLLSCSFCTYSAVNLQLGCILKPTKFVYQDLNWYMFLKKKCLWLKIHQSNAADVMWTGLFCLFCVFYLKIWFKNITLYPADTWSSPHFVISKSGFLTYSTDRITLWFNHLSMKGFKMTITLKYILVKCQTSWGQSLNL